MVKHHGNRGVKLSLIQNNLYKWHPFDCCIFLSPNRGLTIYSLQTHWKVLEITSFAVSSDKGVYALLWKRANQVRHTTNFYCFSILKASLFLQTSSIDGEPEVWLGFVGRTDFFRLYPSTTCDKYWQSMGLNLEDPTLTSAMLQFDESNNLYMVSSANPVLDLSMIELVTSTLFFSPAQII